MLVRVDKMTSAERKASGSTMRRIAESSRVRSNHWEACVLAAFYRDRWCTVHGLESVVT